MNKIERKIELRQLSDESNIIEGCAIVFNSWSRDLGGFRELILPEAVSEDLVNNSDVICNINHDNSQMLARWNRGKGTLNLNLREDGLWFSFEVPPTERGKELLWNVRSGNLFECSFCFSLADEEKSERWYREDGELKREISRIGALYDVSIVDVAAYPETSVDSREGIDLEKINRSLDAEEAKERRREILDSLDLKLRNFLNNLNI